MWASMKFLPKNETWCWLPSYLAVLDALAILELEKYIFISWCNNCVVIQFFQCEKSWNTWIWFVLFNWPLKILKECDTNISFENHLIIHHLIISSHQLSRRSVWENLDQGCESVHDLSHNSPKQTDQAQLIRCLLHGKQEKCCL